jgi:hypothetical protein
MTGMQGLPARALPGPIAFFRATEHTVRDTLRQGIYGWDIPDCTVLGA